MARTANAGQGVADSGHEHTHREPGQYPSRKPVVAAAKPRGLSAPAKNLGNEIREERPVHDSHHRVHGAFTDRNIWTDGKTVVERSAERYLKIIRGDGSYELQ